MQVSIFFRVVDIEKQVSILQSIDRDKCKFELPAMIDLASACVFLTVVLLVNNFLLLIVQGISGGLKKKVAMNSFKFL